MMTTIPWTKTLQNVNRDSMGKDLKKTEVVQEVGHHQVKLKKELQKVKISQNLLHRKKLKRANLALARRQITVIQDRAPQVKIKIEVEKR